MTTKQIKEDIIKAGEMAVKQLVKVAKEEIIKPDPEDELAADRSDRLSLLLSSY